MDHSTFSQYCLSCLKGFLVNNLKNFLKQSYQKYKYGFILGKTIIHNIVYKWSLELEKKPVMIKIKRLGHCRKIYLKHLFAGVMIYWLVTFKQMVSTYSSVPDCSGIKQMFWQISPPISLDHFRFLQEFDLKSLFSPFKDIDKFLKPIPAISFPLTVRHGKVAFEYVTRP